MAWSVPDCARVQSAGVNLTFVSSSSCGETMGVADCRYLRGVGEETMAREKARRRDVTHKKEKYTSGREFTCISWTISFFSYAIEGLVQLGNRKLQQRVLEVQCGYVRLER